MRTWQTKILAEIEYTAKSLKLDAVVRARSNNVSNIGSVHIKGGFTNVVSISFNFQPEGCSLFLEDRRTNETFDGGGLYTNSGRINEMFEWLESHLKASIRCMRPYGAE